MDVEAEVVLEDGEISDDGVVEYIPLERPVNIISSNTTLRNQDKHSDNDSDWSSKSDTDSDDPSVHAKKSKVKIKTKTIARSTGRRKKYDIWSKHVQEDVLAETLVSCDVSQIDRSRDVESYNFPRYEDKYDLRHKINRGHKRRHDHRKNKTMCLERNEESDDDIKGCARKMLGLVTTVANTDEEVAKDIANKLCEEKDDLLLRIVKVAGKLKAIEIFNETKRIEMDGGMLIMNRTRRRTPGGVFIFLLKRDDDITQDQQKEIFSEERREQTRERKSKQRAKLKAIKSQIEAKKLAKENLPELLTRGELIVQSLNESESEEFVNNPPPSPVTDGKENSNDGINDAIPPIADVPNRNLNNYDDDFLDIGSTADMDIF